MLFDAANQITRISENDEINSKNYFEAIGFIDNLYTVLNKIKLVCPIKSVHFKPTFKGKYTCEQYSIQSDEKENEMKYFVVESALFLEDKIKERITELLTGISESIEYSNDSLTIILKWKGKKDEWN